MSTDVNFSSAAKLADQYSGRQWNRPSQIRAEISGQIHVENDGLILGRETDLTRRCGNECGAATFQIAGSSVRVY